jgi:broad specificity phosphatase PhoE
MTDLILYLLRHGESVANVERVFAARKVDPPLSDVGIQQATMQAESLKPIDFSAMYASPLLRARQTAQIVSQHCPLEPILSNALQEVNVGILDGEDQNDPRNWGAYERVVKKWERGLTHVGFPGGESLNDIGDRFKSFLNGLEGEQQKPILAIGHCLLFMAVIWLFCENHGSELEDGHMGRGHLSIISGSSGSDDRFRILKFDIPPGVPARDVFPVDNNLPLC